METLIIENVDLELLDRQRLGLANLLAQVSHGEMPDSRDIELADGILNMLDRWSDVVFGDKMT